LVISFSILLYKTPFYATTPPDEASIIDRKITKVKIPFWIGWGALFFYVGAQTGVNSFFIHYVTESGASISNRDAVWLLSFGAMGLFMIGRISGSMLMSRHNAYSIFLYFAVTTALIAGFLPFLTGSLSVVFIIALYFFKSIMFPTIFSFSLENSNYSKSKTSSYLIMAILGGAIAPPIMGFFGEQKMSDGFLVPFFCYIFIAFYAILIFIYRHKSSHE
jgi:FHS family L-fucose permease-like MFS transporter